ncbi:unnamed protein product, partial [Mesorhabditis belari]|uniref:Arginine and glutamate-rich protein 1 n=1 Tax=Mesorhabditis belari TaxID=2138241 RepID=A0AAF3ETP7_9BILA
MARSRSRSPRRRRNLDKSRDRSRSRDRDRTSRKSKKSRKRSESPDEARLGSILKQKPASPVVKLSSSNEESKEAKEANFDVTTISESAKSWLEERVEEQIMARVAEVEHMLNERFIKQKGELEKMLRIQIEMEMKDEMERIRKEGEEHRAKCAQMEKDLAEKIQRAEQKEKEYTEERLAMLAERSQLERERKGLEKQQADVRKVEQQTILNKGGQTRAPIKFSFGK